MKIRVIEKNNPAEWRRVHELQQAAYRIEAEWLGADPDTFFPLQESLSSLMQTTDDGFIAVLDGLIAGAIFLEKQKTSILIGKLVVDPKFFRRGVANRMLQFCLDLHPNTEFRVGIGARNVAAIRLYESFGFRIESRARVEETLEVVKLKRQI